LLKNIGLLNTLVARNQTNMKFFEKINLAAWVLIITLVFWDISWEAKVVILTLVILVGTTLKEFSDSFIKLFVSVKMIQKTNELLFKSLAREKQEKLLEDDKKERDEEKEMEDIREQLLNDAMGFEENLISILIPVSIWLALVGIMYLSEHWELFF
jgi:hypothetical protein